MATIALGAVEAGLAALWQHKPKVPEFKLVDLIDEQMKTAQGNLEALPLNEQLGVGVNDFLRGERAKTLGAIPGGADIEEQTAANLRDWLAGNIGDELSSSTLRRSNAKSFAGGYQGSGMDRSLKARDLGLTGLDLQKTATQLGSQYLNSAYGRRQINEFDPASMFIHPLQAAQFQQQQNAGQFNRDWLAARIKAQPEAWQQSLMDSVEAIGSMADSIGGAYLGGMVGGMGAPKTPPPPPPPPPPPQGGGWGDTSGIGLATPPNVGWDYTVPPMGSAMYG